MNRTNGGMLSWRMILHWKLASCVYRRVDARLTARNVHRAAALPPIRDHPPPQNQRPFLRLLRRGHGTTRTCLDGVPARRAVRILDGDAHLRQNDAVRGMLVRRQARRHEDIEIDAAVNERVFGVRGDDNLVPLKRSILFKDDAFPRLFVRRRELVPVHDDESDPNGENMDRRIRRDTRVPKEECIVRHTEARGGCRIIVWIRGGTRVDDDEVILQPDTSGEARRARVFGKVSFELVQL